MYRCKVCGVNEVDFADGVCELCSLTYDPVAEAAGSKSTSKRPHMIGVAPENTENQVYVPKRNAGRKKVLVGDAAPNGENPYSNVITPQEEIHHEVKVYKSGEVPQAPVVNSTPVAPQVQKQSRNAPLTKGITKNIMVDTEKKSAIAKYESGRVVNIKRSTLQKLALALDLKGSDLISDIKGKEIMIEIKPTAYDDDGLPEGVFKLIEFAKTVPEDKAALVLQVMKSIVEADW